MNIYIHTYIHTYTHTHTHTPNHQATNPLIHTPTHICFHSHINSREELVQVLGFCCSAARYSVLQRVAACCRVLQRVAACCTSVRISYISLVLGAMHSEDCMHVFGFCCLQLISTTHCNNTLQHTATQCNPLQHTATPQ